MWRMEFRCWQRKASVENRSRPMRVGATHAVHCVLRPPIAWVLKKFKTGLWILNYLNYSNFSVKFRIISIIWIRWFPSNFDLPARRFARGKAVLAVHMAGMSRESPRSLLPARSKANSDVRESVYCSRISVFDFPSSQAKIARWKKKKRLPGSH